ncbi:MAG: hypothetical protein RMZ41_003185 [Nostoc sp. DedVER02]|uniref:hypothetical protein n=1 Tax=unclassified Nostoc TaxID=2593658 RepID=UPI002AD3AFAD|nr:MULTISPECIES: hypothetical protein [unclassified Nostoc]MDZ7986840.1 hypothetical protein [Nostoc sp. DedVER02]MDZ8115742.1 hypothetical protein [Nostoc sp. DedVER01b]
MPGINTSTGSRSSEAPSRFLQQRNDPSTLLRISQQAANQDALSQSYLGNQNQDAAYTRSRNANIDAANLAERDKQNDFNRRMQEKDWDAKQAGKTITSTYKVDNSATNNFNRQLQMQEAQSAAQERLATLSGNSGQSTWRWF